MMPRPPMTFLTRDGVRHIAGAWREHPITGRCLDGATLCGVQLDAVPQGAGRQPLRAVECDACRATARRWGWPA